MMFEEQHTVRELFDQAIDLPAEERSRLLTKIAGDDPALATKVSRLLAASESAPAPEPILTVDVDRAFMSLPDATRAFRDGETIHTPIGEGTVVRLLSHPSRIGNTEVYEVQLPAQGRSVAVKLLRSEVTSKGIRRRFRAEAKLHARLDHPGIATLLAAGVCRTQDGAEHASIVMALVEGQTLDIWAKSATPATIASVVVQVAYTLHFAHLQGVVHRDIKPGNIMVDREGGPRVLDLGVAKLLETPEYEQFGSLVTEGVSVVGTLRYMAPEQFTPTLSRVDLQADVYALGVVLFELLVGHPPVDVDRLSAAEAVERKRDARLTTPRVHGVRPELVQCAAFACAPEPSNRYESCAAFAEDINRALTDRPLHKRTPSMARRAILLARRRPLMTAMTALALSATIAATTIYLVQQHHVRVQRDRAEAQFEQTHAFARWVIFQLDRELAMLSKSADARRLMVDQAGRTLEALGNDPAADDALRLDIATAHVRLGDVLATDLGRDAKAVEHFTAALQVLSGLEDRSVPEARLLIAWSENLVARTAPHDLEEAYEFCGRAVQVLSILEDDLANDARYWRWRSQATWRWSRRLLDVHSDPETIIPVLSAAVTYADRALELDPTDPLTQAESAESRFWKAHGEIDLGLPTAMDAIIEAEASARALLDQSHPLGLRLVARAISMRGVLLTKLGMLDEAIETLQNAVDIVDRAVGADPGNKQPFRLAEIVRMELADACIDAAEQGDFSYVALGLAAAEEGVALVNERQTRGWLLPFGEGHYFAEHAEIKRRLRELAEIVRAQDDSDMTLPQRKPCMTP